MIRAPARRAAPPPAQPASDDAGRGERLQKVLARAGLGSRRACDEAVAAGRVTVNGRPARPGERVDPTRDRLALDGVPVAVAPGLVHYLLHKPAGVVCSTKDPAGRTRALDLVPPEPRVFTVGRLDVASEGLLVLTNDGELAQLLTHPSHGVEKEYLVRVEGRPGPGAIARLRRGVLLEDGPTAPAKVGLVAPDTLRIVVHEGRNRLVRRMCAAVGHPVVRLVRVRIGPLRDPRLAPGQWRRLEPAEVRALAEAAGRPSRR
ncbi:pseudouridine synthase [Aciditerrimonas ferrireducens]|uniref:pseudouridine synthase n=1 Tax=Aciditerrimonas ferrireducens TaxID=667306 RepID=UPI002005E1A7|nr:pseudouridine synthase [Aciditerrimonas ferrireducens]MCK4176697.1 rRNA pseudouridine synthase [Aciditerrimonas ferrireducens]